MKRLISFLIIICACATSESGRKEEQKQERQNESPVPSQMFALPKRPETYLTVSFKYSPKNNAILLVSPAEKNWEVLQVNFKTGERHRFISKDQEVELKEVVAVKEPFTWEGLVNEVCELKNFQSKKFRRGMLLVSKSMCEDELNFE